MLRLFTRLGNLTRGLPAATGPWHKPQTAE